MNKYQEALSEIKKVSINIRAIPKHYCDVICSQANILQELVDRATPKKPIMRDDNEYLECPNCDYPLSKTNYCEHCGQAIDWTNESEQIAKGETK